MSVWPASVSIVGLGHIGLPTAAIVAARGVPVTGVDIEPAIVERINRGEVHIFEADLDAIVRTAVGKDLLRAVTKPEPADVFVIAVPTPARDRAADLSNVEQAAASIAPVLAADNLVIVESTCPVGTTERICALLAAARPDLRFPGSAGGDPDVNVACCPERVLPSNVLHELVHNDRVIGGMTPRCAERAAAFYSLFCKGQYLQTSVRAAELCKLAENAFRDVNIAFANELSLICDNLGVDVWDVVRLANHHPRVNILQPGPGVGGHCIAVDPWFLVEAAPDEARLIATARQVNDAKPGVVLDKLRVLADGLKAKGVARPRVACLGLTFKANVDDIRQSPALAITVAVAGWGDCDVLAVEPHLTRLPAALENQPHVAMLNVQQAVERADIIALLVEHRAFGQIDRPSLRDKKVVDTRGLWS